MKRILGIAGLMLLGLNAKAISVAYTGANGNWAAAANWTPAQVPAADDDVVINASKQVSPGYVAGSSENTRMMCGGYL